MSNQYNIDVDKLKEKAIEIYNEVYAPKFGDKYLQDFIDEVIKIFFSFIGHRTLNSRILFI